MAKPLKKNRTLRKRRFRTLVAILAVPASLALAGAVLSMRANEEVGPQPPHIVDRSVVDQPLVNLAARNARVDGQDSQIRPLTQEEAQQLADGIRDLLNRSQEGLKSVEHANGAVSMDLEGRFQNVALAKKTADGGVAVACVDNVESAAAFLEIQPQLINGGSKSSGGRPSSRAPKEERLNIK